MAWVKIDERCTEHPKIVRTGPVGLALWLSGLTYCNRNLTDGFIPTGVAHRLIDWPTTDEIVARLVEVGVWVEVEGGFEVHDYLDFQPSREQVEEERRKTADRVQRWRERKRNGVTNGGVTPAPDTDTDTVVTPSGVTRGPRQIEIEAVWAAYTAHHPQARLTRERRSLIGRWLGEYDVVTLVDAIDGNHQSPYHCGDNPDGKKYHDLGLILRSADKVERFAAMATADPIEQLAAKRNLSAADIGRLATELERQEGGFSDISTGSDDRGAAAGFLPEGRHAA